MDHSRHVRLTDIEITDRNLKGATVYGANDEKVGTIAHMHGVGNTGRVVIDVGGFLGFGAKSVAVAASELDIMRDESGRFMPLPPGRRTSSRTCLSIRTE